MILLELHSFIIAYFSHWSSQKHWSAVKRLPFRVMWPANMKLVKLTQSQIDIEILTIFSLSLGTVIVMECIAKGPPNAQFSICFQCNETGRIVLRFQVDFGRMLVSRNYQRDDNRYYIYFPFIFKRIL